MVNPSLELLRRGPIQLIVADSITSYVESIVISHMRTTVEPIVMFMLSGGLEERAKLGLGTEGERGGLNNT